MRQHTPILEINWHGLSKKPQVDRLVREQAARLERFADNLMSCRVAIEHPRAAADGPEWRVRLDLTMAPRADFAVVETGDEQRRDLPEVVRAAFATAERRVKDLHDKQREHRPSTGLPATAIVQQVRAEGGVLRDVDGRRVVFDAAALVDTPLAELRAGAAVYYEAVERGDELRATTVRVVDGRGSGAVRNELPEA